MGFQIFTDSAANLPTPFAREHNIGVLCLSYCMEGKSYSVPTRRTLTILPTMRP